MAYSFPTTSDIPSSDGGNYSAFHTADMKTYRQFEVCLLVQLLTDPVIYFGPSLPQQMILATFSASLENSLKMGAFSRRSGSGEALNTSSTTPKPRAAPYAKTHPNDGPDLERQELHSLAVCPISFFPPAFMGHHTQSIHLLCRGLFAPLVPLPGLQ